MPHAEGPCSAAKYAPVLLGSRLTMKLMSPWRYSETSLDRWRATSAKPSMPSTGSSTSGVGEANSTNSKPIKPSGFSKRSAIFLLLNGSAMLALASGGASLAEQPQHFLTVFPDACQRPAHARSAPAHEQRRGHRPGTEILKHHVAPADQLERLSM